MSPTGQYGRLTVIGRVGVDRSGHTRWLCACICGKEAVVLATNLLRGHTRSCGCLQRESLPPSQKTHGRSYDPIYRVWRGMLGRCLSLTNKDYQNYGGRGISVCDRWLTFENFLSDVGEPPDGSSLDRIDNDGNYEPSNCRWATPSEQAINRRARARDSSGRYI